MPLGLGIVGTRGAHKPANVLRQSLVQKHFPGDRRTQLDDAFLRHQRIQANLLEIEVDEFLFFLGRKVGDVHKDRKAIRRRFGQWERSLSQFDGVHGGDRKTE